MIDKVTGRDELGRLCTDLYCMNLSFNVALKSLDPSSKCGCVAVDPRGGFLSAGYNSPPQGSVDANIPLTRPDKYFYFEHAERNCIYLAARNGTPLRNAVFYVTGLPCLDCLRALIQVEASKVVYGPYNSVMQSSEEYLNRYDLMVDNQSIIIERFKYDESLYNLSPFIKQAMVQKKDSMDMNFEHNVAK